MRLKQFKPEEVLSGVGSTVVVHALTCCALFHSMWDLKSTQINVRCRLIQELMFYEFKLANNTINTTQNFCYAKDGSRVDHSTVTKWFKKFHFTHNYIHMHISIREQGPYNGQVRTMQQNEVYFSLKSNSWYTYNLPWHCCAWIPLVKNVSNSRYDIILWTFQLSFVCQGGSKRDEEEKEDRRKVRKKR